MGVAGMSRIIYSQRYSIHFPDDEEVRNLQRDIEKTIRKSLSKKHLVKEVPVITPYIRRRTATAVNR